MPQLVIHSVRFFITVQYHIDLVEAQVFRDTVLSIGNQTKCYLAFHSYGQYWLTPWGYTSDLPDDYSDLYSLAVQSCAALADVYGTQYTIGTSTNVLCTSLSLSLFLSLITLNKGVKLFVKIAFRCSLRMQ